METVFLGHLNSTGLAQVLIAGIWQGLLLTACTWAALRVAEACGVSLRASTRFALWLIVFLLVALLPGLAFFNHSSPTFAGAGALSAVSLLHLRVQWAYALEGLWAVTALVSLLRLLVGGVQMRALLKSSVAVAFSDLEQPLQQAVSRPRARAIAVLLSESVDAPSAVGFFRPAVVVPRSLWIDLSSVEMHQILLHEIAHIQRSDGWTNLLQKLLRAVCPLNPALLVAERHLCRERERACDEAVLDAAGNPRAYASCLTRLAESRLVRRAAVLAPGLWKRPSELVSRVDYILHRRPTLGPWLSRGLVAASLLTSVGGAVLLQRVPSVIAFISNPPVAAATEAGLAATEVLRTSADRRAATGLPPAGYHDAVFHPAPRKDIVLAKAPHARAHHPLPAFARNVRLLALEDASGNRQMFTLVVLTFEVPQTTRAPRGRLPVAVVPDFSFPDSWISFQI